jgi:hypothetical protein
MKVSSCIEGRLFVPQLSMMMMETPSPSTHTQFFKHEAGSDFARPNHAHTHCHCRLSTRVRAMMLGGGGGGKASPHAAVKRKYKKMMAASNTCVEPQLSS